MNENINNDTDERVVQLADLLKDQKEKEEEIKKIPALSLLKKSKFYYYDNNLREHIANYKNYSILLKQENVSQETEEKDIVIKPSIVKTEDLKKVKRVNANIIKKTNPSTLMYNEKMMVLLGVIEKIDNFKK